MRHAGVIALVGRPNVGKSTLFNVLTRSRDALVANFPGLTRDRQYGHIYVDNHEFIVIDTGGLSGHATDAQGLDSEMEKQSFQAVEEADLVLFVVDAKQGLMVADEEIAKQLRQLEKQVKLVINKIDGLDPEVAATDFHRLGFEQPFLVAAAHNRGVRLMLNSIATMLVEQREDAMDATDVEEAALVDAQPEAPADSASSGDTDTIRISIVGRPNVGKSTLVNRLLGEERVVVYDHPGTTRDSIYIPFKRRDQHYLLIDTAGVRRRKNIKESVEKFSIVKTLQAIRDSHVAILVVDARDGIVEQDLHLIGFVVETGKALLIAVNKWDGMTADDKRDVKRELLRRLQFISHADLHFISALHGTGVGHLYESVSSAFKATMAKWSTKRLSELLASCVEEHPPPLVRGRRIKLRHAHQGGSNPPIIVVHGSQTEALPLSYRRYLENRFRQALNAAGAPMRFEFKTTENPYAGRKNRLTGRQIKKKNRMVQHIRKLKKKKDR